MMDLLCHCGSRRNLAVCCQPFLNGHEDAQTPEQLMRSRYSAFCEGNVDYLIRTHHSSQHRPDDRDRLAQAIQETEWVGLRVVKSSAEAERGMVEFVAFFRERQFSTLTNFSDSGSVDPPMQQHERSAFVKEGGRWFYVDGETLPPITIARNDPCWCGGGRKFKQCHGKK